MKSSRGFLPAMEVQLFLISSRKITQKVSIIKTTKAIMKTTFSTILLSRVFFLMPWGGHVNQNGANKETLITAAKDAEMSNENNQGGDIVGDWKLSVETYDENQNKKLDPQERAKAFSNHFFFRFNADGSALVNFNATAEHAFKAKYKLSKRKDLPFISVYIDGDDNVSPDGLRGGYYIISVDKSEMVLLEAAMERAIWIFKKS